MVDRLHSFVPVAQVLGLSSASFLTAYIASFSITTVPALRTAPVSAANLALQWSKAFHLGKATAPPFAIICSGCFAFLAYHYRNTRSDLPVSKSLLYGTAAAIAPCIVPFTQIIMWSGIMAIESKAHGHAGAPADGEVINLIARWSAQNVQRAAIVGSAAVLSAIATLL